MKKRILAVCMALAMVMAFAPAQAVLAVTWTNVGSFTQLKTALENATDTHIRFTGNIELEKKTVTINPSKSVLVIDGGGYTLTSYNSSDSSYTLRLSSKKTLTNITVQNMNIVGYNCYGIVHIPDSSSYSDVTLTYDNVTYTGAQIIAARKSAAVIRDCDIYLVPLRGVHPSEVAAAASVRLEGRVNIVKDAPGCKMEMFHISAKGGGLTVASGAVVSVEDNVGIGKPKDWGFIKVPYESCYIRFENDSKFSYVGNNVFQKGDEIREVYIGKRAEVNITTNGDFYCENGLFAVEGLFTIDEGASVSLLGLGNSKDKPCVWLDDGGKFVMNSPAEALIYNSYSKSSKEGLAVRADGCKGVTFSVNNIYNLEFWTMNNSPYNNLSSPSKAWGNPGGGLFSAAITQKEKKTTSASAAGYTGSAPFNATTATLNNVNVIRVNGGVNTAAKVSVSGAVIWDDSDNGYNTRPAEVTIGLFRNGTPLLSRRLPSSEGSYEFAELDKYAPDGSEYVYTVSGMDIPNYQVQISGYDILNILIM